MVMQQLELAPFRSKTQTVNAIAEIKSQRTEKAKSECKCKYGIGIQDNPFLELSIDLHRYMLFIFGNCYLIAHLGVHQLNYCILFYLALTSTY